MKSSELKDNLREREKTSSRRKNSLISIQIIKKALNSDKIRNLKKCLNYD